MHRLLEISNDVTETGTDLLSLLDNDILPHC